MNNAHTSFSDGQGNILTFKDQGLSTRVEIYLKKENRTRHIGDVNKKERCLYLSKDRSKHMLKVNSSYGFNWSLFKDYGATLFDSVFLYDKVAAFRFDRQFVLDNGQPLFFKEEGFEKQLFVPIKTLERHEVHAGV